jgi:hypothetical protein
MLALATAPQEGLAAFSSATYNFANITLNSSTDSASGGQFAITVWGGDSGTLNSSLTGLNTDVTLSTNQALFVITSTAALASSITDVYFQDGTLLALASTYVGGDSAFSQGGKPSDLPGGNNIVPSFVTTESWSENADKPPPADGVDESGDALGVLFSLQSSYGYSDVVTALNNGISEPRNVWNPDGSDKSGGDLGLRVGIHVQAFPDGQSESFIDWSSDKGAGPLIVGVPAPPSAILLGVGGLVLVGLSWARRRQLSLSA